MSFYRILSYLCLALSAIGFCIGYFDHDLDIQVDRIVVFPTAFGLFLLGMCFLQWSGFVTIVDDDDDDDDDDDSDDREEFRRRRRQIADERKKILEQLEQAREALSYDFMLHERIAKEFAFFLNSNNIKGDFQFEARCKEITKNFKLYGIGFDNDESFAVRHATAMDPAYIFALISYDLACLEAAGVTMTEIPANYQNFSTFFRFYEQLDFYRIESNGFGSVKPTPSKRIEMKRRIKVLTQTGMALHRLLLKNNPKLAKKLEIPVLLEMLEDHYKKFLFLEKSDFDARVSKMLDTPSNLQKRLALLKRDLTVRAAQFDAPAKELRVASISGNTATWFEAKKERKGKRSKKKEPPREISPETMYFADRMTDNGKVTSTPAVETPAPAAEDAAEEEPEEPQTQQRTKPQAADLQKFRREVEAFRREYAGTHALSVEGLSDEYFPILKQTMTPAMWKYFEAQKARLEKTGKESAAAAAEAYLKTLTAEKANHDQISVEEMEKIRRFMKEQKE